MYLVVTNKRDLTSDLIVLELQRLELPYVRLNTEDFASSLICNRHGDTPEWHIKMADSEFSTSQVRAAYFRRPEMVKVPPNVAPNGRLYCAMEWHAALESLYWSLGERWLNAPHWIALAENKPRQLDAALRCGFRIPATLTTNDPQAAAAFCSEHVRTVGKPLRQALTPMSDGEGVVFTTRVRIDSMSDARSIVAAPIILQEEVPKQYDVRATVVGDKVFAATIDSQVDADTEVDWRRFSSTDPAHAIHELPEELTAKCLMLTRRLDLRFAAIDFVLDPQGEYWFLEINPNGQWGWIETRTGHPISKSIVEELQHIGEQN